ncbi:MAG: hypothetical protein M1491_09330 [Deltaproteobacteria bacterium]|nr:hypothetical protein [Deltaproteobacteria bacterium]MCL5276454.1 hypothetical protein [Deltaproteobacteria bacterium]
MIKEQKRFTPFHLGNEVVRLWIRGRLNNQLTKSLYSKGKEVTGFTLVELTVSLVLASLMMIALTGMFILQSKAYTTTRMSTELQDNARTAMDTIDMMISNAGFGVVKGDTQPVYNNPSGIQPFDSAAFCFYTPNASSSYLCNYANPSQGDSYTTATMDGTQCAKNNWNTTCPPYGTDSLTFAYRDPEYLGINLTVNPGTPPSIGFDDTYPYFSVGVNDVGFLVDPNHVESALVTLNGTGVAGPGHIDLPANQNQSFFNELDVLQNASKASLFNGGFYQRVDVAHVYVDYSDANHPVLMMQTNGGAPVPLADDIEDFQVQFIMDDSNLTTGYNLMGSYSNTYTTLYSIFPSFSDQYYDPVPISPSPPEHQNPLNIDAVMITIVARSDVPSPTVAVPPAAWVADHNTAESGIPYPPSTLGPLANYQRQTYQRIIQLPDIRTASQLFDNRGL